VEVLELKNKSLLSKWLYKLMNEEGVWQVKVKNDFFSRGSFNIGKGKILDSGKTLG
jgi:hypothetical protein